MQSRVNLSRIKPRSSNRRYLLTTKEQLYNSTRNTTIADNPRDTFWGQSRSPNIVPFDMLGMVSY